MNKKILCKLGIHSYRYDHSVKAELQGTGSYREYSKLICERCGKSKYRLEDWGTDYSTLPVFYDDDIAKRYGKPESKSDNELAMQFFDEAVSDVECNPDKKQEELEKLTEEEIRKARRAKASREYRARKRAEKAEAQARIKAMAFEGKVANDGKAA